MGGLEKMANTIQDAYRIVLNDMLNSGCGLFVGEYDARNGDEKFMHGISTVMEWIAYKVSEEDYNEFNDLFIKNLIKSEQKALTKVLKRDKINTTKEKENDKNESDYG
jgi:hypothetical protein